MPPACLAPARLSTLGREIGTSFGLGGRRMVRLPACFVRPCSCGDTEQLWRALGLPPLGQGLGPSHACWWRSRRPHSLEMRADGSFQRVRAAQRVFRCRPKIGRTPASLPPAGAAGLEGSTQQAGRGGGQEAGVWAVIDLDSPAVRPLRHGRRLSLATANMIAAK